MRKIVCIGDDDSLQGFKMIGVSALVVPPVKDEVLGAINAAIKEGALIIFIVEECSKLVEEDIERLMERFEVTITRIPSSRGSIGAGITRIRELCIKALGTDMLSLTK